MSFSARDLASAADIYDRMLREKKCAVILTLAGSTSAAGCMQVYVDLVKNNMVDVIVATGASIVDMDFLKRWVSNTIRARRLSMTSCCAAFTSTGFTTPSSVKTICSTATKPSRKLRMPCRRVLIRRVNLSPPWANIW